ncbi:uncharacterized membrane protein YvlD (DUF360 family) [Microbacterium keratanolyticum]|uniref:Superfamily IV 4 TMS phage holin n=1 Tax=Microbacterium keratanolyticum TaxID=67574 RepID=A0A9W6HUW3_9MICO|nr:phage holin family protein [Microbacterium keratanolyticum]MBM7467831.1 uncharacterized membrane protein YvlD (DUF360 family) [Microbacterium keratanolyticum]GLK02822.1 hypothetical protein GCM10017596_25370 [Microbacterium keratanolyticum]
MITFLFRTLILIVSAGLGLLAADLLLDGFTIEWDKWWGFVICIVIFTVLQSVLAPWITVMAKRYAPVLLGGIGIISTLVSLIVVVLLPIGGLRISGALAWILGAVIVWVVTALGAILLPLIFLKKKVEERRER